MYGPSDTRLGSEFAGYRLEAVVGRGGMGAVYRAEDVRLARKVAVKLISPELAADERFRERFLRESRVAASLDHPHVVPIHAAGDEDGVLFLAMRYVEGTDLAKLVAEEGPLVPERALALLEQVAEALDAAHERGLVHRDVKPSNILIARAGGKEHSYLADFGLMKHASSLSGLTAPGQNVGTLDYIAPEQVQGEPVGGSADVYSLGCVLHECLTGTPPFAKATDVAVLWAHVHEEPPPVSGARLDLPRALDEVLARALAKEPERRYQTCGELAAAARTALGAETAAAGPRTAARRFVPVLSALSLAAAVALALGLALWPRSAGLSAVSPNAVGIIDVETNELVGEVAVGVRPEAVAVGAGGVWVANVEDETISRIDPSSRQLVRTIAVNEYPSGVATGAGAVWVAHGQLATLTRILPEGNRAAKPIEALAEGATCGGSVASVAVAGGMVWLACVSGEVGRVNPRSREPRSVGYEADLLTSPTSVLPEFSDVAFGLGSLWIANRAANIVIELDPATGRPLREITVGRAPSAIAVGRDALWVAASEDDAVSRIEVAGRGQPAAVTAIPVGDAPVDVAFGGGALWVANSDGTVSRIDPERGEVVATISIGNRPRGIAVGDGAVWVTVQAPGGARS